MPLYEFRCARCGELFEELVPVGTETSACRACGEAGAERVLSGPAPPFRLVKTGAGYRRQDEKNRQLHQKTKADFKAKMAKRRADAAAKPKKGGGA